MGLCTSFGLKDLLDKVLADRPVFRYFKNFKFKVEVEDFPVKFDRAVLYWIVMRMLSNAENAVLFEPKPWIKMQTYRYKDGDFYLIVRNNGKSIEERAKEASHREGGKSMPNIKKICKALHSGYILKGFPDHTSACLKLPLAEKKA